MFGRYECLVDTEDLQRLIDFGKRWIAIYYDRVRGYYAESGQYQPEKKRNKTLYLHRIIMNIEDGRKSIVHHKNHDTLDNRKENLEVTNYAKNLQDREGANKNNNTGVRNVSYIESDNSYYVQIMKNGEKFFKRFPTNQFKEACEYARQKRIELFGKE